MQGRWLQICRSGMGGCMQLWFSFFGLESGNIVPSFPGASCVARNATVPWPQQSLSPEMQPISHV